MPRTGIVLRQFMVIGKNIFSPSKITLFVDIRIQTHLHIVCFKINLNNIITMGFLYFNLGRIISLLPFPF